MNIQWLPHWICKLLMFSPSTITYRLSAGFSLLELLIGMTLGSFLLLGLISSFSSSSAAFTTISDRYELLQNATRGLRFVESASREAGFPNLDISDYPAAISTTSQKTGINDSLVLEGWSRQNCFGNPNPVLDSSHQPALYFRQQRFQLQNDTLRWRCGYGVDSANLVIQSNNQTLINNVATFTVRYFEDSDLDSAIDRAVKAGNWNAVEAIQQLEIMLSLYPGSSRSGITQTYRSIVRLRNAG